MAAGYQLLITSDGALSLANFPWQLLSSKLPKIVTETISWAELQNKEKITDKLTKYRLVFVVADPTNNQQVQLLESLVTNEKPTKLTIFLLQKEAPPTPYGKPIQKIESSLKPDFIVSYIDRCIVAAYYQLKYEITSADEIEWLTRLEKIFDLTTEEIMASDMTAAAYENLVKYEEKLLEEHRKINQALERLQDYRDRHKIDWIKEREARETIESFMAKEIKDRNEQLKAQEMLLQYTIKERETLYKLMQMFKAKGSLSKEEIEELLTKQNVLLHDIERLARITQPSS